MMVIGTPPGVWLTEMDGSVRTIGPVTEPLGPLLGTMVTSSPAVEIVQGIEVSYEGEGRFRFVEIDRLSSSPVGMSIVSCWRVTADSDGLETITSRSILLMVS